MLATLARTRASSSGGIACRSAESANCLSFLREAGREE